jgi:hypothetical protein
MLGPNISKHVIKHAKQCVSLISLPQSVRKLRGGSIQLRIASQSAFLPYCSPSGHCTHFTLTYFVYKIHLLDLIKLTFQDLSKIDLKILHYSIIEMFKTEINERTQLFNSA